MKLDYDLIEEICQFRHNNNNGKWNDSIRVNLRDANLDDDGNIIATFKVGSGSYLTDMFIDKDEYQSKLRDKKLKIIGI
jgi:hypothetical protein